MTDFVPPFQEHKKKQSVGELEELVATYAQTLAKKWNIHFDHDALAKVIGAILAASPEAREIIKKSLKL